MEISRGSKECFRGGSRKFHVIYRLYKDCSVFDRSFKGNQRSFKGLSKQISKRFQESVKNVSRVFFGSLEGFPLIFEPNALVCRVMKSPLRTECSRPQ